MFINAEHAILDQEERIETLRLEIVNLTKDRDKVYEEIRSQRDAKVVVSNEQRGLESLTYLLDKQATMLVEIRDKNFTNFTTEYSNHTQILSEIEQSIESSKKLLSEYQTTKEDIQKLENTGKELSDKLVIKRRELQDTIDETKEIRKALERERIENERQLKEIEEGKEQIKQEAESLRIFKKDLDIMDARLKKMKAEFNSK